MKENFEELLSERTIITPVDEQIVYDQLDIDKRSVWSLLLASGYLKVVRYEEYTDEIDEPNYELCLTNREVKIMFRVMVKNWFRKRY